MALEHPAQLISKTCEKFGVSEDELLSELLFILQQTTAGLAYETGFAKKADNTNTMLTEVHKMLNFLNHRSSSIVRRLPTSLIAALDLAVERQLYDDKLHLEDYPLEYREAVGRRMKVCEALRSIFQELIRKAEQNALECRLETEQFLKDSGMPPTSIGLPPDDGE